MPFLVGAIMRAARVESVDTVRQQKTQIRPIAFLIWMVLVCEGAAFTYVLAGGYSLDPRNRYIIMPMVIMSAAAAIWLIWGPQRTRTFWPRCSSVAISAICIFGVLTSLRLVAAARVPTKRALREYVEAGGLMSYGPNFPDLFREAADCSGVCR